jgi:hypothetical protein
MCASVTVYGFGKTATFKEAKYQYYVLGRTHRSSGNPTHSFGTEEQLMVALAQQGYITFCNDAGCSSSTSKSRGKIH